MRRQLKPWTVPIDTGRLDATARGTVITDTSVVDHDRFYRAAPKTRIHEVYSEELGVVGWVLLRDDGRYQPIHPNQEIGRRRTYDTLDQAADFLIADAMAGVD
jgi:hypothetical protein